MSIRTLDSIDPNQASSKSQSSKLTNGATSASSRTRRQVADINLSDYTDDDRIHPPAVPEVPRGPPLSYRQPYEGESLNQQPRRSFSQRAKGHMLAREALEDNHYWDDNDTTPLQLSIPEAPRKSIGRNDANSSLQNGFKNTERERTVRRGSSERQPPGTSQDNSITPKTPQDLASSVRHAADVQPLNLDLPSPSTQINAVKGSKNQIESQRKEWANDRSPLQTLEVKLNDISKEEKRARVEEAEMLLRESKAGRGGHRSSREASAATKGSPLTKEPPPEPNGVDRARVDRSSSTAQRDVVQSKAPVELQKPSKRPSAGKPARRFDDQENLVTGRTANVEVLPANQPRSLPQSSRDVGQPHPAHGSQKAMSSDKPRQASFQESAKIDVVHPAHDRDPRTGNATGRAPDESALYADQRNGRLQNEVRRATSARQAPMAQSIPSNITRAVSLQQHQNQPLYSGDQETARSGPMRESNSSHKAALADTSTATGAGGAIAATSLKRDNSRKLQKLPSTNVNQNFQPEAKGLPDSMHSGLTSVPSSANVGDTKVELYYKGMPRQVDVQRPSSQRAPEPASLGLKKPATTEQSPTANKPRRASVSFKVPSDRTRPVNEWKQAGTARLTLADLTIEVPNEGDQAWWEMNGSSSRRRSKGSSGNIQKSDAYSQQESVKPMEFKPPLYLKCGPLLRYTGMRRDRAEPQPGQTVSAIRRETWRGSVMIVTNDSQSTYEDGPTLRIFSQPRDLLPPPPDQVEGDDLAPEYVDPIAGLTKVSRRGQTLYVKPVDHLEEGKDLSRIENDDGLFETSPSPLDNTHGSTTANKRTRGRDGESIGKYKEVKGCRLHADIERGVTFWRFNIEVELSDQQAHIAYRINHGPAVGFWVPAKGQSMNIMFHSCNGFSLTVNSDQFGGPDPLWRDVLNTHQTRPFHVMIGGGDQIYNDRVMIDTNHFAAWTHLRNPHEKHHAPFTDEMREELESFYLNRYAMWFSQGLFGLANSQIPMVNIYDDHDIIDGFGSYPDDFQKAPVFMGVGNIAFKYYMLFQHQSVPEETQADEPCWLLGARPGPYIQQRSRSVFLNLGRSVAFLGLDCRTERERHSVLTDDTYELVLERCRREIEEGETKHLLVLLGVPIAYPRLVWLESILTSRAMAPVKALGRAGILKGGFMNKFDGGVEVLDDLDDHWTASGHKEERNNLIQDLQDLAAEKSIRITILGGDVHLGAVGQFYSNPKLKIPKDRDHRYIPNVISSAIVNTPPPEMLADTLNKRNKVHLFDPYTMEDMIPMFTHDVDGKKRNNKRLLPRRNWCSIREYHPGSTPPPTPPESLAPSEQMSESEDYPPQTRRRFSISREDANPRKLLRRLSQRGGPPSSYRDDMNISTPLATRRASHDGYFSNQQQPQTAPPTRTSFSLKSNGNGMMQPQTAPPHRTSFPSPTTNSNQRGSLNSLPLGTVPRPGIFRRPTNLSEKAGKKGGPPSLVTDSRGNLIEAYNDHINLEGGLDITLNCEVSQGDPAGITTAYRLLVPALWYDGSSDSQKLDGPQAKAVGGLQRKPTLLRKLGFGRMGNRSLADRQGEGNWGQADFSESENGSLGGGDGQADDDQYYDNEKASFGGGTLKRWFSGRRGKRNEDRYDPEYEQPQVSQQMQQRGGDEFVGRELRTTPPETQPQWATPSPSKRGSYGYDATPIEPFPSQARGKAARVMGVDQGPMLGAYSSPAQPPQYTSSGRQPPQQGGNLNSYPSTIPAENGRTADTSMALNQSQPLPPLNGTGTSANKTTSLPFSPQSRQQRAAAGDGGQDGNSRFYSSYGDGSGAEPTIRGYSGVEAYPGKKKKDNKGGKLKKGRWYDVGGL